MLVLATEGVPFIVVGVEASSSRSRATGAGVASTIAVVGAGREGWKEATDLVCRGMRPLSELERLRREREEEARRIRG